MSTDEANERPGVDAGIASCFHIERHGCGATQAGRYCGGGLSVPDDGGQFKQHPLEALGVDNVVERSSVTFWAVCWIVE